MLNSPAPMMTATADADLDAFNAAFDELGFEWRWNRATMAELAAIADDKERVWRLRPAIPPASAQGV
jgi:hypothetical protein